MGKSDGNKRPNRHTKNKQGNNNHGDNKLIGKPELRGHYFKVANPDAFNKTMKAIIEFVQMTYQSSKDICRLLETLEEVDFPPPTQPVDGNGNLIPETQMTFVQKEQIKSEFKKRNRAEEFYNNNKTQVVGLLLGQCYNNMKHKLEGLGNWVDIKRDPVGLIMAIKAQSFKYRENEYSGE